MKADILTPPSTYYGVTEYVNERPDPTVPPPEIIASITVPKKNVAEYYMEPICCLPSFSFLRVSNDLLGGRPRSNDGLA